MMMRTYAAMLSRVRPGTRMNGHQYLFYVVHVGIVRRFDSTHFVQAQETQPTVAQRQ